MHLGTIAFPKVARRAVRVTHHYPRDGLVVRGVFQVENDHFQAVQEGTTFLHLSKLQLNLLSLVKAICCIWAALSNLMFNSAGQGWQSILEMHAPVLMGQRYRLYRAGSPDGIR